MIYKTLHRKLKIEQHGHHLEPWMNSGDPEGVAVPVSHWATVVFSCYKSGYKSLTWEQSFIYFVVLTTSLR